MILVSEWIWGDFEYYGDTRYKKYKNNKLKLKMF
jgi:hypothetical protein